MENYLIVNNSVLDEVLDKIKKTKGIQKIDNAKKLIEKKYHFGDCKGKAMK